MCFDLDSRPPVPPLAGAAVDGRRLQLNAEDGTRVAAYLAEPKQPSGAGMLILPDVRGLHPFYEELALRFAENGIGALAIDYFGRTAGSDRRGNDFDHGRHVEQTQYSTLLEDMKAGRDELAGRPSVRAVFCVGFCFGGRLAFLSASRRELQLSGAVGFYGPTVGQGHGGAPAPTDLAGEMSCPILGLFGGADRGIAPESIEAFRRALTEAGVIHELVTYDGAPHSFFDRRAADFADASVDAWRRILEFVKLHTPATG